MPSKCEIAEFYAEVKCEIAEFWDKNIAPVPGTTTHKQVLINNDDENYVLPDTNTHGNVWIDDAANLTVVY